MRPKLLAGGILLAHVLLAAQVTPAAAPAPPASAQHVFKQITMTRSDSGSHYLLDARLEGVETRFIVDSGSSSPLVLAQSLAAKLGKTLADDGHVYGLGGASPGFRTTVDDLLLGQSLRMRRLPIRVSDLSHLKNVSAAGKPAAADGLVGSRFLKTLRGAFDFRQDLLIYPASGVPQGAYRDGRLASGDIVLPLREGAAAFPFVTINLKDRDFEFLLDTGASLNSLEPELAAELGLSPAKTAAAGSGPEKVTVARPLFAGQQLGSLDFLLLPSLATQTAPAKTRFGGIIGIPLLKGLGATLDFDSYSLVIPKARAAPAQPR